MDKTEARRGKIRFSIGDMSFEGEGDQQWLDRHIQELIDKFGQTRVSMPAGETEETSDQTSDPSTPIGSLATYIREKGGETVQIKRFLATAAWLWHREDRELTSKKVSAALRDNQQKRLGNTADCLNKTVARGFCEKTPNGFFITPEGWSHLGETAVS